MPLKSRAITNAKMSWTALSQDCGEGDAFFLLAVSHAIQKGRFLLCACMLPLAHAYLCKFLLISERDPGFCWSPSSECCCSNLCFVFLARLNPLLMWIVCVTQNESHSIATAETFLAVRMCGSDMWIKVQCFPKVKSFCLWSRPGSAVLEEDGKLMFQIKRACKGLEMS